MFFRETISGGGGLCDIIFLYEITQNEYMKNNHYYVWQCLFHFIIIVIVIINVSKKK